MTDLVLYEGGTLTKAEEDLLWERCATRYLELQDSRNGRKVKIADALAAVLEAHPGEYVEDVALASVKGKDFSEYLAGRRKEHLLVSLVPSLYAAEYGGRMGALAAEQLLERLEGGEELETKDLLAIVKTGYELAAKADKKVEDATGTANVSVNLDVKTLLLGMTPEQFAELSRRALTEGK